MDLLLVKRRGKRSKYQLELHIIHACQTYSSDELSLYSQRFRNLLAIKRAHGCSYQVQLDVVHETLLAKLVSLDKHDGRLESW